jgi:endogenous inhibitor of DNA gyrase (YacG/DUF329 family)
MTNKKVINCPKCSKKVRVPIGKHIKFTCPSCDEELEYDDRPENEKHIKSEADNLDGESSFSNTIINLISWILAIPIFIIAHKLIPNPDWILNLDRILLGILLIFILRLILKEFRILVIGGFLVAVIWLSYGSFLGNYGFAGVYRDYKEMIHSMANNPHPERIIISKLKPFKNKSEIKEAVDFDNANVRNFALSSTKKFKKHSDNNSEYRTIIQCFAIFKEINKNWNYVSDPNSREYYAKASESIKHLSGDCDDHSILMAACIKAIGGVPRLIRTNGHLYPELLIGTKKDLESINYIVKRKLFKYESKDNTLKYHIDENNQVWLNLDYTAKYPGGPFMSEKILGVLTLN